MQYCVILHASILHGHAIFAASHIIYVYMALEAVISMGAIFDHPVYFCLFSLLMAHTIFTDSLWEWKPPILVNSGNKVFIYIEENDRNKIGGWKIEDCWQVPPVRYISLVHLEFQSKMGLKNNNTLYLYVVFRLFFHMSLLFWFSAKGDSGVLNCSPPMLKKILS